MPEALKTLFNLFPQGTLALVGGYVRSHLLGTLTPQTEADFATTLTPEESQALLQQAGLLAASPGLKWGTVTARVKAGEGEDTYDITSTRTDLYTPGNRYPQVTYGATWAEDAIRRDLTCNAVYLLRDGTFFDPFDGVADLLAGRMRFIGTPSVRLAEDPLRLLRYLRFSALYGTSGWDNTFPHLQAALPLLATLSHTRKQAEFAKLAVLPTAAPLLAQLGLAVDGTPLPS